jgi:uncharacterized protein (TIGR01244 family)
MVNPVALTDRLSVAGQITKADIPELKRLGFTAIINNRPDGEESGQLDSTSAGREAGVEGLSYSYQPVTTSSISRADVEAFRDALEQSPGPVLAHCRSGTRCTLLWSLGEVLFADADPVALIERARAKGFDITALQVLLPRMRG